MTRDLRESNLGSVKGKDKYAVVDNPLTQSTQSFIVTMLAYSNILAAQLYLDCSQPCHFT